MTSTAAISDALEILRCEGIEAKITTIFNGGKNAAIVLPGCWREYGICEKCGRELEDKRYNECGRCRGIS